MKQLLFHATSSNFSETQEKGKYPSAKATKKLSTARYSWQNLITNFFQVLRLGNYFRESHFSFFNFVIELYGCLRKGFSNLLMAKHSNTAILMHKNLFIQFFKELIIILYWNYLYNLVIEHYLIDGSVTVPDPAYSLQSDTAVMKGKAQTLLQFILWI